MAAYAQDGFKITGKLGGNLGGKLVLVGNGAEGAVSLGETVMIDGDFEFTGWYDLGLYLDRRAATGGNLDVGEFGVFVSGG